MPVFLACGTPFKISSSVPLYECKSRVPERIDVKFLFGKFYEKLSKTYNFGLSLLKIMGILQKNLQAYAFFGHLQCT